MKLANASSIQKSKRGVADKKQAAVNKRNAAIAAKKGLAAPEAEVAATLSALKIDPSTDIMDISKPVAELSSNHIAALAMEHVNKIIHSPDVSLDGHSIFDTACVNLPGIAANSQLNDENYNVNLKNMMTMTDNMMTSRIEPMAGKVLL